MVYGINLFLIFNFREKELEFVATQNTTTDYDGWLRFNATGALVSWTHFLYPNRGFYVSVHSLDNKGKYALICCNNYKFEHYFIF